jgi:type I restriction enzyme R subunit
MFLTGFDSKMLNTLYVDKNLKHHGLIQAFSRTNRIVNEKKSQGNIVSFRNLKEQTDNAIALFSNKDAKDIILMQPYEEYVEEFNKAFAALIALVPSVNSVDNLIDEEDQLEFIKTFRELMRLKNVMSGFSDFSHNDLSMNEQLFEDYKSKYLDLYERHKHNKESQMESILDDVDFEIELIRTDLINVSYILKLLAQYRESSAAKQEGMKKQIMGIIEGQEQLRSKKELIEAFIDKNLMAIPNSEDIEDEFDEYLEQQKSEEFERLCEDENLNVDEVKEVIETYLYDQRKPFNDDISKSLKTTYPLLQRRKVISRVLEKVMQHIEKFYEL